MIEGLRLLPFIHEAERRGKSVVPSNCEDCMQNQTADIRKTWGCGFEPAATGNLTSYVRIPKPEGCSVEPTVCPGYSTRLPEVIETMRARLHWSKGSLDQFARGFATERLLGAIEVLEGAANEVQAWAIENPMKKAGA